MPDSPVLVIGASGYVGNRLVPQLLHAGFRVRACGRSLANLKSKIWSQHANVELVEADILRPKSLSMAISGCEIAYYLVHSMNKNTRDFARKDRQAALNMVSASESSQLRQIIYLGGLGEDDDKLSKHLRSRAEVASILQSGSVPVTVLRAAMIIGSGSASFELLRYLVERLPVMVTPESVDTKNQPIAIENVLAYLVGCLGNEKTYGEIFDIGGSEILTYRELIKAYAKEANIIEPTIISTPYLSGQVSAFLLQFATPIPGYLVGPLAEGMSCGVVCKENRIRDLIPLSLLDSRSAIGKALETRQYHDLESLETEADMIRHPEWVAMDEPDWVGGTVYSECYRMVVKGSLAQAWKPIVRLGGETGYYFGDQLWQLRGLLDLLFGGVGMRKGRRHPTDLAVGDALDFWRVLLVEPDHRLVLLAEMKLPGEAVLEFRLKRLGDEKTEIVQILKFLPNGIYGMSYWHASTRLHGQLFVGMLEGIARASKCKILEGPKSIKMPASVLSTAKA